MPRHPRPLASLLRAPTPVLTLVEDEREIVARIRAGDERAFEAIFTAHYEALHAFAQSYVKTASAAEEIVQDVFLNIWDHRATWQVTGGVRAYLFGAVRNRSLNAVRRGRIEHRLFAADAAEVARERPSPASADLATYAAELDHAVQRAIAALPERMRFVVQLRWQQGMSHAEIASAAGISVAGVEKQMGRAMAILRKALAGFVP